LILSCYPDNRSVHSLLTNRDSLRRPNCSRVCIRAGLHEGSSVQCCIANRARLFL
jgi:hypothetical protein